MCVNRLIGNGGTRMATAIELRDEFGLG